LFHTLDGPSPLYRASSTNHAQVDGCLAHTPHG
jgi:hypothetical protein